MKIGFTVVGDWEHRRLVVKDDDVIDVAVKALGDWGEKYNIPEEEWDKKDIDVCFCSEPPEEWNLEDYQQKGMMGLSGICEDQGQIWIFNAALDEVPEGDDLFGRRKDALMGTITHEICHVLENFFPNEELYPKDYKDAEEEMDTEEYCLSSSVEMRAVTFAAAYSKKAQEKFMSVLRYAVENTIPIPEGSAQPLEVAR